MTSALLQHAKKRRIDLQAERDPHLPDWRTVAEYIDPYAGRYLQRQDNNSPRKLPSYAKIINGAATGYLQTMDAGFMGGHTSKSRPWFRSTVAEPALAERADVRAWLDDVTQAIRDVLAKSNFYTALPDFYHSRHLFGVAAMLCVADDQDVVRFYTRPIGTYSLGCDARGRVNAMHYSYPRTAAQLREEFGEDALPQKIRAELGQGKLDTRYEVQALIEPNPDKREGMQAAKFRPYRHVYWIEGMGEGCDVLDIGGYYDNPILGSRWAPVGTDVYGPSPALSARGDIKQLQYLEGEKLRLIDLMAQPPLSLPDSLRNDNASLRAGARIFMTPSQVQQRVEAIYTPDPRGLQQVQLEIDTVQKRIGGFFFADLFRMLDFLDDRERTAYEISERKEEKVAMLSPALEALTDEVLDPTISLVYAHMDRQGLLPPPPEALVGQPVQIEYTSMLAQAQKAAGLGTIERTVGFVGQLFAMTQNPAVLDTLDVDQAVQEFHDRVGGPARIIRDDEAIDGIRQQRAEANKQAQMAQMAPAMKQGAEALKTLSETVPQEGSALEGMAGVMGGAA